MIENLIRKYFNVNDLLLVVAMFIALGLAWNTIVAMQRNYRLQQRYDALQAEVELYELENQNLKYNISYLKSDGYLELAARDKFGKAVTGESLVYLPDNGEKQSPVAKSTPKTPAQNSTGPQGWQSNVQAWWRFLQGRDIPTVKG